MIAMFRRNLIFLILISLLAPTQSSGQEYLERLKEFVDGLRKDYSATIRFSHEFMVSSYYYNLGSDLQLAANVLTQSIAKSRSDAIDLASTQARLDLLVEELRAGRLPNQSVLAAYRTAYFDQFEIKNVQSRLALVFRDIESLQLTYENFCSPSQLERARRLFQPQHYYASTVFSVITPPAPHFGGYAQFTFDSQGNLTDADAGPGSGPQQLPPGYTDEEHALVWGTGASAASLAAYLGAGSAAGPIGVAVVIVGYAVLSGIENKDRVQAIEDQVDLMEEADSIHDRTIAEIKDEVPALVQTSCKSVAANVNISGPIEHLVDFSKGESGTKLVSELNELGTKSAATAIYFDEWLQTNLAIDAEAEIEIETQEILNQMSAQWDFEEQNAGRFWSERINDIFVPSDGPDIVYTSTVEQRAAALDAITWGDCRYALCYPLANDEVPSELDPYVSIVWSWNRERLANIK